MSLIAIMEAAPDEGMDSGVQPPATRPARTYGDYLSIVAHPAFRIGFLDAQAGRPFDHDSIGARIRGETPASALARTEWPDFPTHAQIDLATLRYEEGRRLFLTGGIKCRAWGHPDFPPAGVRRWIEEHCEREKQPTRPEGWKTARDASYGYVYRADNQVFGIPTGVEAIVFRIAGTWRFRVTGREVSVGERDDKEDAMSAALIEARACVDRSAAFDADEKPERAAVSADTRRPPPKLIGCTSNACESRTECVRFLLALDGRCEETRAFVGPRCSYMLEPLWAKFEFGIRLVPPPPVAPPKNVVELREDLVP